MTSRQREYQKKMAAEGRCQICGQAEYVKGYCLRHYRARMARLREDRGEVKQEQTCSFCGEQGHNRRTCPERREMEKGRETDG